MSPIEQLFAASMLAWTAAAQAALWQITRTAPRPQPVRTGRRRSRP